MAGKKTYRSANGQDIDMERLILKNENVRAVGNMNVNARGDVIDNANKTTSARSAQVNKNYRKQIGNVVQDTPVVSSKKAATAIAEQYAAQANEETTTVDDVLVGLDDTQKAKSDATPKANKSAPAGGLAAAIAKAREVKQEPKPSPREEERNVKGVKKI